MDNYVDDFVGPAIFHDSETQRNYAIDLLMRELFFELDSDYDDVLTFTEFM
jgi:hypothetical protein